MNNSAQPMGLDLSQVNMVDLFDDSTIPAADTAGADTDGLPAGDDANPDKGDDQNLNNDQDSQADANADASSDAAADDGDSGDADGGDQSNASDDSSDDGDSDSSVIAELGNLLGYEIEGDFEDSYEGIASYTQQVADKIAEQKLSELFEQMPDVQKFMQYRINGGDSKKYFQTAQQANKYAGVEIAEDNTQMQKQVISALMEHQGYNTEEISETMEDLEDTGLLYKKSVRDLNKLSTLEQKRESDMLETQRVQAEQAKVENTETWNNINQAISTGSVKGININQSDRRKFYDWMAKPVDAQGRSQRMVEREKFDTESMLAMEYMVYKGFDLSKLAVNAAKTSQTQNLKSKLQANKGSAKARMSGGKSSQPRAARGLPGLDELF
jgi:hypothetical protein